MLKEKWDIVEKLPPMLSGEEITSRNLNERDTN